MNILKYIESFRPDKQIDLVLKNKVLMNHFRPAKRRAIKSKAYAGNNLIEKVEHHLTDLQRKEFIHRFQKLKKKHSLSSAAKMQADSILLRKLSSAFIYTSNPVTHIYHELKKNDQFPSAGVYLNFPIHSTYFNDVIPYLYIERQKHFIFADIFIPLLDPPPKKRLFIGVDYEMMKFPLDHSVNSEREAIEYTISALAYAAQTTYGLTIRNTGYIIMRKWPFKITKTPYKEWEASLMDKYYNVAKLITNTNKFPIY